MLGYLPRDSQVVNDTVEVKMCFLTLEPILLLLFSTPALLHLPNPCRWCHFDRHAVFDKSVLSNCNRCGHMVYLLVSWIKC